MRIAKTVSLPLELAWEEVVLPTKDILKCVWDRIWCLSWMSRLSFRECSPLHFSLLRRFRLQHSHCCLLCRCFHRSHCRHCQQMTMQIHLRLTHLPYKCIQCRCFHRYHCRPYPQMTMMTHFCRDSPWGLWSCVTEIVHYPEMSANVEVVDGQEAKRARCIASVFSRASGHCVCVEVLDCVALLTIAHKFFFGKGKNCHKKWTPRMVFIYVGYIKNDIQEGQNNCHTNWTSYVKQLLLGHKTC